MMRNSSVSSKVYKEAEHLESQIYAGEEGGRSSK